MKSMIIEKNEGEILLDFLFEINFSRSFEREKKYKKGADYVLHQINILLNIYI